MAFEVRRKDGVKVFVEANARLVERESGVNGILVIIRDITERKRAEEEIKQRNRELAALNKIAQTISQSFDLNKLLNDALDKTLEILNVNLGAMYLTDKNKAILSLEAYQGVTEKDIEPVSTIPFGEGHLGIVAQSGEALFVESFADAVELIDKGAEQLVSGQRLKSAVFVPLMAKGEVLGAMGAFTQDNRIFTPREMSLLETIGHQVGTVIDNARLLEEASRAEALEELDRLRSALLASVSHELRTPLTAIKGIADTLIQPDVEWDAETRQDFLMTISHESDVLTRIVEDLMQMSQMEAGMTKMEKKYTRISTIIKQLGDRLERLVPQHHFEINMPRRLP